MARRSTAFLLSLAIGLGTLATAPAWADDLEGFAKLASWLAREHAIPAEVALAEAADGLEQAAGGDCPGTEADLAAVRAGFHATMDAWMGIQHVRFGPITYLQRDSRLYFWPDKTNALSRQLGKALAAADPALLDPESLARGSVALQGLPALERLLFGAEAEEGDPDYRCRLIGAITANIAEMARGLLYDWRDSDRPYLMLIETADSDDALFADSRDVVGQFLRSLDEALLTVDELRLGRPLGTPDGRAFPRRAESRRSGRSARNVRLILDALASMAAPTGGGGFAGLLRELGETELAQRLAARFDKTNAAARTLGDSLAEAIEDEARRPLVRDLRHEVRETRELISAEVAPALGVTLGFNAMDGD